MSNQSAFRHIVLVCPICRGKLLQGGNNFSCGACGEPYPIVSGVPILINDRNSVFRKQDYSPSAAPSHPTPRPLWRRMASKLLKLVPDRSVCFSACKTPAAISHILAAIPDAKILVIGCGEARLVQNSEASITYTDVTLGTLTQIVCDAHNLPFEDQSFDAILAIAVIEHVIYPTEVVKEIERVLKHDGFFLAAVPFLQAVHMGAYDFTRWTYTGMRALFAGFTEISSGIANGPSTTLVWASEYFLSSFFTRNSTRAAARSFARLATSWIGYIDQYLNKKPGSYDGSSAFYFFGRKSKTRLTPRQVIALNRGLNPR